VTTVAGVGKVLTFGHRVLYVHKGDSKRHSTCTGVCAMAWPPLIVSTRTAHHLGHVHGLGTFHRTKGRLQVTINGHPLYFFVGDKTPNSAKGQGFANIFFTVRANGSVVHVAPAAAPAATSTSSTPPSTPSTQGSHGTQSPAGTVPTSPPPTSPPTTTTSPPPTTTTTNPPTTTTTAPSGGGVSF
jgi:predicted lipoprotein with Yx(FWY)xxD motif